MCAAFASSDPSDERRELLSIADRRSPARTAAWPPPRDSISRKFGAVQVARGSLIVLWWDRTERVKDQRQPRPNATSGTSPRLRHSTRSSLSTLRRFSQKRARRTSVPCRNTSSARCASTCSAGAWRTAFCEHAAARAARICSSRCRVRSGVCAHPAMRDVCVGPLPI